MNFLLRVIITAIAAIVAAWLLPGVSIDGFLTAIVFAFVLALLNSILKPILVILTIPITLLTFGLFLLVINALLVLLADRITTGVTVEGFWWALLFSIVLSIVSAILGIDKTKK